MTPNDRIIFQKAGMILGSLFGVLLAFMTWEDWSYRSLLLTAPERVTLRQLIDQGYSGKRHIVVTDFRWGSGYAVQEQGETWLEITVPMFAIDDPQPQEILAVVISRDVRHIRELPEIYSLEELDGVLCNQGRLGLTNKILSDGNKKIPIESPLIRATLSRDPFFEQDSALSVWLDSLLDDRCIQLQAISQRAAIDSWARCNR